MSKILLLLVFVFSFSIPGLADSYVLDTDICTGGCGAPPYGTIDLTQGANANTVHVVISLTAGNFIHTGQPGSTFAFNISGNPTISVQNFSLSGWSLDSPTAGSLHAAGFSDFEYSLNCCFSNNGGANAQP